MTNEVFQYLDAIQPNPKSAREEIGYKPKQITGPTDRHKLELKVGAELLHGLQVLLCDSTITDKQTARKELHEKLQAKYPMFKKSIEYVR
jgi:hypothetical protein